VSDPAGKSTILGFLSTDEMARLLGEHLVSIGMSQAEFARRVGVSPKHLNQVLTGKATARMGALDYWAFVLGMQWTIGLVKR
jgi:transcriptional regulator with XRE-family HTH domain